MDQRTAPFSSHTLFWRGTSRPWNRRLSRCTGSVVTLMPEVCLISCALVCNVLILYIYIYMYI